MDVGNLLSVGVAHDVVVRLQLDGPRRREAAVADRLFLLWSQGRRSVTPSDILVSLYALLLGIVGTMPCTLSITSRLAF